MVRLTNLKKPFWPELGISKRHLLQYYAEVAPALLPRERAMVMKRYPDGAYGKHFFMKRAPAPRPDWIETCRIDHGSGNTCDGLPTGGRRCRSRGPTPMEVLSVETIPETGTVATSARKSTRRRG